jgi:hypothetical protein
MSIWIVASFNAVMAFQRRHYRTAVLYAVVYVIARLCE